MEIKAVLFDMDGTILDSEPMHTKVIQELVKERFDRDLSEDEILGYMGLSYDRKLKRLLKKRGIKADWEELDNTGEKMSIEKSELVEKMDYAEEVIKKMNKQFKIALVTGSSKDQAEAFLKNVGLRKYFQTLVTASDVEKNKPNPDSYLSAAKKLAVKPEECVAIEDSPTGMKAAKNAGMKCIIVRNKYNRDDDLSNADKIVDNLDEITVSFIRNLN